MKHKTIWLSVLIAISLVMGMAYAELEDGYIAVGENEEVDVGVVYMTPTNIENGYGVVVGAVKDKITEKVLVGALVMLEDEDGKEMNQFAISNENGEFRIENVPVGIYKVLSYANGYKMFV